MASPYDTLHHVVAPLDDQDRAEFARQARIGRIAVGCVAVVLTAFACVAYGASGPASGDHVSGFAVFVVGGAFGILGLALFALRPAMTERAATKRIYTGVVTGKRSVEGHAHASPPHATDSGMPTPTTMHYAALGGVEFELPVHLAAKVEPGRAYHFHALGESQVFRIDPAPM